MLRASSKPWRYLVSTGNGWSGWSGWSGSSMPTGVRIDDKALRAENPEAVRLAVLGFSLDSCGHHVAETARTFGFTRASVHALKLTRQSGSLADRSRAPHHRPRQTPAIVEAQVIALRNQTHLGAKRLSLYLAKYEEREIPCTTIRHLRPATRPAPAHPALRSSSSQRRRPTVPGTAGAALSLPGARHPDR